MDNSFDMAELPDNNFTKNFDMVSPFDLQYQPDTDYRAALLQDWALLQDDYLLRPQDPDDGVRLNIDAQHETDSEQAPDALYQLQATQDPTDSMVINTGIQHSPGLERVPCALDQTQGLQDPHNSAYLNENSQSEILDQLWDNLEGSLLNIHDFDIRFSIVPDSEFTKWEGPPEMTNQFQVSQVGCTCTTHSSANADPTDELTILRTVDTSPLHQSQGPVGGFITPHLTWTGPAPDIEQPPLVQEYFPPAPRPPVHYLPNNQHANCEKQLPPPPIRENKRPKGLANKVRGNIKSIDPSKYYQGLPEAPQSWTAHYGNGTLTFKYNEYGNLSTNDKFSPCEILAYLYQHPLNYYGNNVYDPKNGRLKLWIQTVPAGAGIRYPDKMSDKCRFADCPVRGGSIRTGFFRVSFDEHTGSGRQVDPYHCAGFVHLFCLEKFCNFAAICRDLNVLPDQRNLPEGKNKMAVTRDHPEMAEVVRTFIQSPQKIDPWDYEQTLSFQLTSKHLELQYPTRQNKRIERGGNHIELHKGDLDRFVAGESQKQEKRRNAPEAQKPPKRKRGTNLAEEREDLVNLEDEVMDKEGAVKRAKFR